MTFTEAAVEVLRLAGEPLHYRKITELAMRQQLLSHVGKNPEVTMSSRLATLVRKDRGEALIVKVKPGVFGLREFGAVAATEGEVGAMSEEQASEGVETLREESADRFHREVEAPDFSDVFDAEDDDDEPILGAKRSSRDSANAKDKDGERDAEPRSRSRRRGGRRRGGRSSEDSELRATSEESADSEADDCGEGERRGKRGISLAARIQLSEQHADPLAVSALEAATGSPRTTWQRVAESLVKRGALEGAPRALAPTIAAVLRGTNTRLRAAGRLPLLRELSGQRLVARADDQNAQVERQLGEVERWAQRQRASAGRHFLELFEQLPVPGRLELFASWLAGQGLSELRALRVPGLAEGDFQLIGQLSQGLSRRAIAIVLAKGGRTLSRADVIGVRGALHHFEGASEAWLITSGSVDVDAVEEACSQAATCVLFDGDAFAADCQRFGLGLQTGRVEVAAVDRTFLEALGLESEGASIGGRNASEPREGRGRSRGSRRGRGRSEGAAKMREDEAVQQESDSDEALSTATEDADFVAAEGTDAESGAQAQAAPRETSASVSEADETVPAEAEEIVQAEATEPEDAAEASAQADDEDAAPHRDA